MLPSESDHTAAQTLLAVEASRLVRSRWRSGMTTDFDGSWAGVRPAVEAVARASMVGAARNGARLVPAQLEQMGAAVAPSAVAVPDAFGVQTMLGNDVGQALDSTVIRTKEAVGRGATPQQALDVGEDWLDDLIRSITADANRAAQQVTITATPRMGWVRIVNAPSCQRCAVLSGRWYRHSAGFARHFRCDCTHRPAPQDGSGTGDVPSPADLAASGGIKDLSKAQAQAIKDGADPIPVINSRRGSSGMTTTEGTTRRGTFGAANPGRQRLTPAGIYRVASDRDEAVTLLRRFGYIRD